jgi:ribosomal protein L24
MSSRVTYLVYVGSTAMDRIKIGDKIEVCEGSWAARKGVVVSIKNNETILVDFGNDCRAVRACTTSKAVDEYG